MILIILGLSLMGFIVGFLAMPSHRLQWLVGGLSLIVMVTAATLMISNDTWHWGMRQSTTTQTTTLQSSAANPYTSLLLYAPVRHAKAEKVYVYRAQGQAKLHHSAARLVTTNRVTRTTSQTAKLVSQQRRWTYQNQFWRWLFSWTGHHNQLVKETNTFELPSSWQILSVTQAKWLAKRAKQLEAERKTATAKAVTSQVKAAKMATPQMSKSETAALVKKVEATAKKQAVKQAQTALPELLKQARQQSIYD